MTSIIFSVEDKFLFLPWLHRSGWLRRRSGFTLVEMLTTVAILIIALGLMVSLARYVRSRSAEELTRRILVNLHTAMLEYSRQSDVPAIESFIDNKPTDEVALLRTAMVNNKQVVKFFQAHKDLSAKAFRDIDSGNYDNVTIRDAWGTPIVFMPAMHRQIGMAPNNEWFFFSAGPDRQYLTRDDNQYSYEALGPESSR
jgi:type II secretory pathway pseudopilin PulG